MACNCDHWFAKHCLDLSSLYDAEYVRATYGTSKELKEKLDTIDALPLHKSDNKNRVLFVNEWFKKVTIEDRRTKSVLDVGGGLGVFLRGMLEAGWQGSSVELDPLLVEHLRNNVGIDVYDQDLRSLSPELVGRFDLITFNKVLEHVIDPVELLVSSLKFLKHDGVIYFEVPDNLAAQEGQDREEFTIEHHHVFSMYSAVKMAENSGLLPQIIQRLREPSSKFTIRCIATKFHC